jgi:hypothetical protein
MRLSPLAAVAAACVLTLTACGDDGADPKSSDQKASPSASSSPQDVTRDGSKKDKKGDQRPDLGEATVCKALDAGAVGEIIDATLKRGKIQSNTCVYADPKNPGGTYVGVSQVTLESAGGEEAVATSLSGLVTGEPEQVSDIGDQAYVIVGASPSGQNAAAGVVAIGDAMISVGFPVASGVSPDDAKEQVTELLELVSESL